jgi:hypothetical protein
MDERIQRMMEEAADELVAAGLMRKEIIDGEVWWILTDEGYKVALAAATPQGEA